MKLGVSEILKLAAEAKGTEQKIEILRQHFNPTLGMVLRYALDPSVKWDLPEGDPPFKRNEYPDQQGVLYAEARRLYLFIEGGNPNLSRVRRETLFIQFLENIDPDDAKVILAAKDKKLPYKGLTAKLIDQAYPGLLPKGE